MGRYYFNLYDDTVALDEEGAECPDLDAARARAVESARAMACAEVLDGHLTLEHRIEVLDENRALVCTVHFRDVVAVEQAATPQIPLK